MQRESSIREKLNAARRELLDLTTRNRLLHTPRHRERSRSIEIVDECAEEVFRILVSENRAMSFVPAATTVAPHARMQSADNHATQDDTATNKTSSNQTTATPVPTIGHTDDRVGAWTLDQLIGRGTFGEVWSAHHHQFADQRAAVKLATDPTYVRFLRQESQITHKLNHPNIVAVLDADVYADPPYMTMELVEGVSLRKFIGGTPLDVADAVHLARQILQGIGHAHENNTIHHDLKPENILIANDGTVKLVDFGLGKVEVDTARSVIQSDSISSDDDQGLRGSLPYMSPEQIQGRQVDLRCDLFAFGKIWFELLTGRLPLGWDEKPSSIRTELDRACDEIYAKSTASLMQRATSAESLLRMLESVNRANAGHWEWTNTSQTLNNGRKNARFAEAAPAFAQPDDDDVDDRGVFKRHTDNRLQSTLPSKDLQRRLLKTYYDANTFEEEQGSSPLYLALGFLKWFERDKANRARFAPLILVPVVLERRSAKVKFRINFTGDEITTNLSLQARLKEEFGIDLPETPETDDISTTDYFEQVAAAVSGQPLWEVLKDDIVLSFFSFSKFIMFRDLDPDVWPDQRAIDAHPLITSMLGDGFADDGPMCGDDDNLDRLISPADTIHVLNADSSQAHVIEEVRRGRNLVVQGPPGTGKSQTIANLIAAAVRDGKKILFMAEKMAALNVVKRRLDNIGLGELCLELHSRKAKKKLVLDELKRTLELGAPTRTSEVNAQAEVLTKLRDQLNEYAEVLHTAHEPSNLSPYQVIGGLIQLRAAGTRPADFELDEPLTWSPTTLRDNVGHLQSVISSIQSIGQPSQHVWRGTRIQSMLPTDMDRLAQRMQADSEELASLISVASRLSDALKTDAPADFSAALQRVKMGRRVVDAPPMDGAAMGSATWQHHRHDIVALLNAGQAYTASREQLSDVVLESGWEADAAAIRRDLAMYGSSMWRWFRADYRRAVASFRALMAGKPPKSLHARLDILTALQKGQAARQRIIKNADVGRQAFGHHWRGEASDWEALARIESWDTANEESGNVDRCRSVVSSGVDPDAIRTLTMQTASLLETCTTRIQTLLETISLDVSDAFECEGIAGIPLASLATRLGEWRRHIDRLPQWLSFQARQASVRNGGMTQLADRLYHGRLDPSNAVDALRLAYYEALIREMFERSPLLQRFDGKSHERLLAEFRKEDVRRIELTRQEVALAHYENIPRGVAEIGQMGIIRHEIEKQRRHLPLRQLLRRAGHAIQRIKPVMMMSPISIAQFLSPDSMEFDLLLIDEASQVRPVDALGAVARARQIVVVGDDKQLPPTRFFDRALDDDTTSIDDDTFAAGDVESILGLCAAQRMPNRMLRWHYRSRHHSLIAVSNEAFYSDRLHVIPSPSMRDDTDERLGLSLCHLPNAVYDRGNTRRNIEEARVIADAVVDHARRSPSLSLGVGTFSVEQRDAILDEIEERRRSDAEIESFFSGEVAEPFFVKNLENIQGDERDVIFISVGYGPDATGRVSMNFGPLSAKGGERRLNVLITRARRRSVVYSSMLEHAIDESRVSGLGPKSLKAFLKYAARSDHTAHDEIARQFASPFEASIARALEAHDHTIRPCVGVSGFFVDLSVVAPDEPTRYALGVECDGPDYASARWARDRDRLRIQVLEDRGWTIHRAWSPDWFRRPDEQIRHLCTAINEGKSAARSADIVSPPSVVTRRNDTKSTNTKLPDSNHRVPYKEAVLRVPADIEIHQLPVERLAGTLNEIVAIEGPIHREEITRRVCSLWGHKRVGSRIADAVNSALHWSAESGALNADDDFYTTRDQAQAPIRDRSDVESATLRKPEMLPPAELRAALLHSVKSHAGVTADEAILATARCLGFKVTTPGIRDVIESQFDILEKSGAIQCIAGTFNVT